MNKAATIIQKRARGMLGRQLVKQRDLSARKIQGFVRSKWLVELRLKMRKAATYIQAEQAALLPSKMSLLNSNINNNTKGGLVTLDAKEARISRDDLMLIDKKISFFLYILDFEILTDTSEIYDPLWNKQYAQLMKELLVNSHDITYIQVGDTHSIAGATNGKLYCWGWDDYGQISADASVDSGVLCSKRASTLSWVEEITRPQVLVLGSNHTFVLDVDNNLYVQGKNNLGQLGLGHNEIVEEPERLDLKINQTDRVKIIKSRGDQSAVVTEKGSVFLWPIQSSPHEWISEPFEIAFPMSKVIISSVSCGINFQIFLAQSGLLFSLGSNSAGELGLGDTKERRVPCLIERLKQAGEKIQSVECGQKHSIAKSGQNKLFTWGYGGKSQLGHGTRQNELFPKSVSLPFPYNKEKVMQAQACARSCIVLLESRKLFWWGSNNTVKQAASPVIVNLGDITSGEMYPARIETTWSRSLAITYLRIADARTLDQATQFKQKLVNTLITKWTETHLNQIDVPFFESIGKNFSNRHVLKSYSGLRRVGPKYPRQGNTRYFVPPKLPANLGAHTISPQFQHGDEETTFGYEKTNIIIKPTAAERESLNKKSTNASTMDVFDTFVRSSSKKQFQFVAKAKAEAEQLQYLESYRKQSQMYAQEQQRYSQISLLPQDPTNNNNNNTSNINSTANFNNNRQGSQNKQKRNGDDEYLLDGIKMSPNAMLEHYKNEVNNNNNNSSTKFSPQSQLKVSQFDVYPTNNNNNNNTNNKQQQQQQLSHNNSQNPLTSSRRLLRSGSSLPQSQDIQSQSPIQLSPSRAHGSDQEISNDRARPKSRLQVKFSDDGPQVHPPLQSSPKRPSIINNSRHSNGSISSNKHSYTQEINNTREKGNNNNINNNQNSIWTVNQNIPGDNNISAVTVGIAPNFLREGSSSSGMAITPPGITTATTKTTGQLGFGPSQGTQIAPTALTGSMVSLKDKQQLETKREKLIKEREAKKHTLKYSFLGNQPNQQENNPPEANDQFISSLHQKLAGIKSRMSTLNRIPREEWTIDDHQFMSEVSDSKMIEFFRNIA